MTKREAIKRLETDFAGTDLLEAVQTAMKMPQLVKGNYHGTYELDIFEVPYGCGSYLLHAFFVREEATYTVHTDIYVGEALQHHHIELDLSQDIDRQMSVFDGAISRLCADYDEGEEITDHLETAPQQEPQLEPQLEPQTESQPEPQPES